MMSIIRHLLLLSNVADRRQVRSFREIARTGPFFRQARIDGRRARARVADRSESNRVRAQCFAHE
jgi:hypothetical protein